jgi:hypothetical protein
VVLSFGKMQHFCRNLIDIWTSGIFTFSSRDFPALALAFLEAANSNIYIFFLIFADHSRQRDGFKFTTHTYKKRDKLNKYS